MRSLLSINASDLAKFLANPEDLLQESSELQIAIATFPETPRHLLEILVNSPEAEVAEAAQLHINYAGELTDNWQDIVDKKLKSRYLGQNDRLAVELLKIAPVPDYFLSEYVPSEYLIQGLSNPYLPLRYRLRLLERLAKEPTLEPRLEVAESPEIPLAVLEQLIGDLELPIRLAVQYNPSCPPELVKLIEEQHELASNWDTDAQQLANLADSRWDWIRLTVAQNPSTSEETLLKLARDKVFKIQLAVAKNPATPASVLSVLAEHSKEEIQAAVAIHPNSSEEILHSLFPTQQRVIKSRQNLPSSILERIFNESPKDLQKPLFMTDDEACPSFFSRHPNTPTWILAEFANIDLEALKIYAENNYNESPIVQSVQEWINDRSGGLVDIAKHPQISVEILEKLAEFDKPTLKLAIAQNSKISQVLKISLLKQLINSSTDYIKVLIASDPQTPVEILKQLSGVSSALNTMMEMLSQIAPEATPNLLNRIKAFIDRHQSPELISFWLQQGKEFQVTILNDWDELINSLTDEEKANLAYIASQESSVEWKGKFTVQTKTSSRHDDEELEPKYELLHRLLDLLNNSYNNDVSNQDIIAALLGNSNTPGNLREQLWQQCKQEPDNMGRYSKDIKLRIALAFNTSIAEEERMKYFEEIISFKNLKITEYPDTSIIFKLESIAKNPKTPVVIIEKLLDSRYKYNVAENPSLPESIFKTLVLENNSEILKNIAQNPNIPLEFLMNLAENSDISIKDNALKNPNLPMLDRYRLLIKQEQEVEIEKTNQILAKRTDSSYALARVVETGDLNAKISAARNRKTPIQILEQLTKDKDETVRQIVVQNPNLSLNTLLQLAKDKDETVRRNVACNHNLPLNVLLELAEDSSETVRASLTYKNPNHNIKTPIELLEKLVQDESERVRINIAENPDTPVELLSQLANDPSVEVCRRLIKNKNTPVEVLEFLGVEKGIADAYNTKTPGNALAAVVENTLKKDRRTQEKIFEFLLRNLAGSQMPADTLIKLSVNETAWIRSCVASHDNTPASALEKMIDDDYSPVLWGISRNPNATPQILEKLVNRQNISDKDIEQIYRSISQRQDISVTLMEKLLQSNLYEVRENLVYKPNLPLEIAAQLINNESQESVLIALAHNLNLTTELLNQFVQHSNPNVCQTLVKHPNLSLEHWQQLAAHSDLKVREAVAFKTNPPVNILETLAQDPATDVRVTVGENKNTPSQILEQLSQDVEAAVRTRVAANPNTPNNVLENLALDEKVEVRRAVANNPHSSKLIRDLLQNLLPTPKTNTRSISPTLRGLSRIYNPNTDDLASVLSEYVNSDVAFVRFVSLLHPLTPTKILENGANSSSWIERYAIADNPATPTEIKQQLTQDSNQIVRSVAISNLSRSTL